MMKVPDVLNVESIVFDLRAKNVSAILFGRLFALLVLLEAKKARKSGELHFWEKNGITRDELRALTPTKRGCCRL